MDSKGLKTGMMLTASRKQLVFENKWSDRNPGSNAVNEIKCSSWNIKLDLEVISHEHTLKPSDLQVVSKFHRAVQIDSHVGKLRIVDKQRGRYLRTCRSRIIDSRRCMKTSKDIL